MSHIILPILQLVLFFVYLIVESFEKVLMRRLAISSIVAYRTTIIPNTLNKLADCMKLRVVKGWLT